MFLVEVDDNVGLGRVPAVQCESNCPHSELLDEDTFLLRLRARSRQNHDEPIRMMRNFH